jgi:choline dehydrogenase-like flavoprotein
MPENTYDVIAVGSGFATSFFLHELLKHAPQRHRILVLERGPSTPHAQRLEQRRDLGLLERRSFVNESPVDKQWIFSFGVGGSSQCWWANTPRMLPADFELRSRYGVGVDWPVTYDELEPYYSEAEELMQVSGPDDGSPFPRSRPYPQPPHRFSEPDLRLKRANPGAFFVVPTARPSRNVPGGRPACCGSSVCELCPIDSKFTIRNGLYHVYEDPRVELIAGARAERILTRGSAATGVEYEQDGRVGRAEGDLVVLGANAIFNPFLLLRSGLEGPEVGSGLCEQVSDQYLVLLDGLDNFQGSTSVTGHGYRYYDGEHRAQRAGVLLETFNRPELREERGKWLQLLRVKAIFEDLRQPQNHVGIDADDPARPRAVFVRHSEYAERSRQRMLQRELVEFLAPLPVEGIRRMDQPSSTESHIMGTTVMGTDPATSVVDRLSVHHRVRNLVVLGSSTFPTAAPANPTLTLCALSLWSARRLLG